MKKTKLRKIQDPRALELFGDVRPDLLQEFKAFHKRNPVVLRLFEQYSLKIKATGRTHYSHWAVAQRVRWHSEFEADAVDFRLPNNFIAIYARLVVWKHPHMAGFFKFKKMGPRGQREVA